MLHAAGLRIDAKDGLLPANMVNDPVFEFEPISVTCEDDGQTAWQCAKEDTGRYIFTLRHPDRYADAMTASLCKLLSGIGTSNKSDAGDG